MSVVTLEAIVEQGQIRLPANIHLPEKTKVYVIVPDVQDEPTRYIYSPRLVHPEQSADFKMQVIKDSPDAGV